MRQNLKQKDIRRVAVMNWRKMKAVNGKKE